MPHTFSQVVSVDPTTDITGQEAETLTDGSDATGLHYHGAEVGAPGSPNGFEDRTDCTLSWSIPTPMIA